jgi:GDP-4-dehydro-6-deoxy-D-mannose reductase
VKALVTGACGFVAPYLMRSLVQRGYSVVGTYVQEPKTKLNECAYLRLDICNFEECRRVISDTRPDVIFHLAGIAYVPEAEGNFDKTLSINVAGTHNLIRIAHLLGLKSTFVFVSSAEVYGRFDYLPVDEKHPARPESAYSLSKLFSEQIVEQYHRRGTVKGVIVRPFNHIGAGQDSRFMASNFALQLARIATGKQEPVIEVGNLEALRDFTDVQDIVEGYIAAASKPGEIFNLCSGKAIAVQSILDTLIKISGCSVAVKQDPNRTRPSEVPEVRGSYQKAKEVINWQPKIHLEDSLKDVFNYWVKNLL